MHGDAPLRPLYVFTAWAVSTLALPITKYLRDVTCAPGTYFTQRIANYSALLGNSDYKIVHTLKSISFRAITRRVLINFEFSSPLLYGS